MKFKIPNQSYQFISDDTQELDGNTAFFVTKQNAKFHVIAKDLGATFVTQKELIDALDLDGIKTIGITGTNGKTTTAAAIYSFLIDLGEKVGFQGTRGFFINDERVGDKGLTTPPLLQTLYHIYQAKERGCGYFVMEVSSHAIDQGRVEGLKFAIKVFTNLTQDHLDYHKTFDEYQRVKSSFFSDETPKLINKDAKKIEFNFKNGYTYALDAPATFNVMAFTLRDGISALVRHFDKQVTFNSPLYGLFNVYNLLAAIASVKLVTDRDMEDICEVVENFAGVSGRMEVVSTKPLVIVDFAHTPDGMQQVLDSLKDKEISLVFGAGGDRDRDKRPMMGRVADRFAKKIYLTNDNPRSEEPMKIIEDIYQGIKNRDKVVIEEDRRVAIKKAVEELNDDEILLLLGKGDEDYQIVGNEKLPFDDRVEVKSAIKDRFNL